MGILIQERLRPKRMIVGAIAKIGAKENLAFLQRGKANPILIGRRTDESLKGCGNLPIKWSNRYCIE